MRLLLARLASGRHAVQLPVSRRVLIEMRSRGVVADDALIPRLSLLGWDHINLTDDYVWSEAIALDDDGFTPLRHAEN